MYLYRCIYLIFFACVFVFYHVIQYYFFYPYVRHGCLRKEIINLKSPSRGKGDLPLTHNTGIL